MSKERNAKVDPLGTVGKHKIVDDFLPPPEELLFDEPMEQISLRLESKVISFFREAAKRTGVKYQKLMREVLSKYAKKYG